MSMDDYERIKGREEGITRGFIEGYLKAMKDIENSFNIKTADKTLTAYATGYANGYSNGYVAGEGKKQRKEKLRKNAGKAEYTIEEPGAKPIKIQVPMPKKVSRPSRQSTSTTSYHRDTAQVRSSRSYSSDSDNDFPHNPLGGLEKYMRNPSYCILSDILDIPDIY